jgi:predicted dehydrogenase
VKVRHFLIGGSRRSVLYNELDISERVKVYDRGIDVSADTEDVRRTLISYRSGDVLAPQLESTEPLGFLVQHFAECIERGTEPISGGAQGVRIVRILDAATRSLQQGGIRVNL